MDKEICTKGIFTIVTAYFVYLYQCVGSITIVLGAFMIIDYITGLAAAWARKEIDSSLALKGIIKKTGYIILLFLSFSLDYILGFVSLQLPAVFGVTVCIWLIGTEGISILENLSWVGVPLPKFLIQAFKKIKKEGDE